MKYNGHKNKTAWNVSLWISNDEWLYNLALECIALTDTRKEAAKRFLSCVTPPCTPDNYKYSITNVVSAMRGM